MVGKKSIERIYFFDFGEPDFDYVRRIDWSGVGGSPLPLFHMPQWPNEETLIPVFAKRT